MRGEEGEKGGGADLPSPPSLGMEGLLARTENGRRSKGTTALAFST